MKIKELREENGLTQLPVAKHLSVKQNTYSQYENGKRQLPIEALKNWQSFITFQLITY